MRYDRDMERDIIVFGGITYRRYPDSHHTSNRRYYRCGGGDLARGYSYLHRAIWVAARGPIPAGHDIHHVDGDTLNNDFGNLACLPEREHHAHHGRHRDKAVTDRAIAIAQEAARAWHGTDAGREWHRHHGHAVWDAVQPVERTCERCGATFESRKLGKVRFCSGACRMAHARATGTYDEIRICVICQSPFTAYKYSKARACSRLCGGRLASGSRRGL